MEKFTPEQYGEKAYTLFTSGYNCAQAVFCAFGELLPFDENTARLVSCAFGGGMGRLREVCGCLSGCLMVLGILCGEHAHESQEQKAALYAKEQAFAAIFKEKYGSLICRELLAMHEVDPSGTVPEERTAAYYQKRPCPMFAKETAAAFAKFLYDEGIL